MNKSLHIVLLLVLPALALGHHSSAIYDMSQQITVEGTVTKCAWANPHVYIYVEQVTDSKEVIAWAVEFPSPAEMRRRGWTEATVRPGDKLTFVGSPTRRTTNRGISPVPGTIEVNGHPLLQTGRTLSPQQSSASTESNVGASSLGGTLQTVSNVATFRRLFGNSAEIRLTEAGNIARASYDEATMSPLWDCTPYAAPLLMINPDPKQIIVTKDVVTIKGAADRTIYMNVKTHDGAVPSLQGHSIGHWEGETLVIDTANFSPHRIGNGYRGIPSGLQKRLIERIELREGGKKLSYSFELTDPEFLAQVVTGNTEWAYRPDMEFIREPCDLSNARQSR